MCDVRPKVELDEEIDLAAAAVALVGADQSLSKIGK
jgi:hypothetical protein